MESHGVITQTFPSAQLPPNMQKCQITILPVTLTGGGPEFGVSLMVAAFFWPRGAAGAAGRALAEAYPGRCDVSGRRGRVRSRPLRAGAHRRSSGTRTGREPGRGRRPSARRCVPQLPRRTRRQARAAGGHGDAGVRCRAAAAAARSRRAALAVATRGSGALGGGRHGRAARTARRGAGRHRLVSGPGRGNQGSTARCSTRSAATRAPRCGLVEAVQRDLRNGRARRAPTRCASSGPATTSNRPGCCDRVWPPLPEPSRSERRRPLRAVRSGHFPVTRCGYAAAI